MENSLIMLNYIKSITNKNFVILLLLSCLVLVPVFYLATLNEGIKISIFILFFVAALVPLINFHFMFFFLLLTMFLPHMMEMHQIVFIPILLVVSLFVNFKNITLDDVRNPLLKTLLIYLIPVVISFINTKAFWLSLRDSLNLAALILTFIVTLICIKDRKYMMNIFYFFIVAIFLHSLYVNFLGITTGRRVFGLLGVYFIDFAGLGSVLTFIMMIYAKNIYKVFYAILFFIITVGLILTQTRNAWLTTGFSLFSLFLYLAFKGKKLFIKRDLLIFLALVAIGVSIIFILGSGIKVNQRSDTKNQTLVLTDDPESSNVNSYFTRLMIWHTAANAILKHPMIGIGAYSFKHSSQLFYTIPKPFFNIYVKNKTPHVAILQVLTETGVLGLIVFSIFIFHLIKFLFSSLKKVRIIEDVKITLLIVWSLVYIVFSMLMTESWLYGQYAVWFGILLGLLINNQKQLEIST